MIGAHQLSESNIIEGLATRPPQGWVWIERSEYDPVLIESDRKRIEEFYARHGFFSARVKRVSALAIAPGEFRVDFVVAEGQPSRLVSVLIEGDQALLPEERRELAALVDLAPDEIFDHQRYLEAKRGLETRLIQFGFAHAKVSGDVDVDPQARQVRIRFQLQPGPRTRFGQTQIRGLGRIPRSAVEARMAWEPGDQYDPARIEQTRKRLFQLGVFNSIRIDFPHQGQPAELPIQLDLVEGDRHEIKLGAGAGLDRAHYEIRARLDYGLKGFLHPLNNLRLQFLPAYRFLLEGQTRAGFGGEATVGLEQNDFLAPRLRAGLQTSYTIDETEAYVLQGLRLRLGLDRPFLDDRLVASLGYQLRLQSFLSINPVISAELADELGMNGLYRLAFFEQTLAYDGRDDPLETRSGFFTQLRLEEGGVFSGGKFSYLRLIPELRGYLPLGSRVGLAARIRFGWVAWSSGAMPITQRFFAGGSSSQRGFSQQQLSPQADDGQGNHVPIGGLALLESSLEVRLDVVELFGNWFGLVAFVDGADVTATLGGLDLGNLHWAAGGGLRYRTPVGPIRFDLGVRVNRTGPGNPSPGQDFAFHISLGEAF